MNNGSIYKIRTTTKKGVKVRYRGQLSIGKNDNGKPRYKCVDADTWADCKKRLATLKRDLEKGLDVDNHQTVGEYLKDWFEQRVKIRTKVVTQSSYQMHLNNHLKHFAGTKLRALTPQQVQQWLNAEIKKDERSTRAILYSHSILRSALNDAVKWRVLEFNPALAVDLPKQPRFRAQPWSPEEARQFLDCIQEHRLRSLYTMALLTGMRQGELLALQWTDLDLDNGTTRVEHTLTRVKGTGLVRTCTKTEASERIQYLPQSVVATLREHKLRQDEERGNREWWNSKGWVFVTRDGYPIDACNLSNDFVALLKKHNLRRVRFHDCRHFAASAAIASGASVKAVSEMLGHSSPATTLQVYAHSFQSAKRALANHMDTVLTPETK